MAADLKSRLYTVFFVMLAFLAQTSVAPKLRLLGVQPDFVIIITMTLALMRGPVSGSIGGFVGGFLRDLYSQGILGLHALVNTLIGYFIGRISEDAGFSIFLGLAAVFFGSMAAETSRISMSVILGIDRVDIFSSLFRTVLPFAIYNTLLFPLIFLAVEKTVGWPSESGAGTVRFGGLV